MDDSGHGREASARQGLSSHSLSPLEPKGEMEQRPRETLLLPPARPFPQVSGKLGSALPSPVSSEDQPEELLVERAEHGDDEAFGILSVRYEQRIYWYIRRLVENDEVASDLTQEALLKAWLSLPTRDQKRTLNFRAWLYSVAYSVTVDHKRKYRLENLLIPLEHGIEKAAKNSSWTEKVESSLCKRETIIAALKQVYPQYRQCLVMRYVNQQSFQEIAQLLNIHEVTARANISRGRKQFIQAYLHEMHNNVPGDNRTREEGR